MKPVFLGLSVAATLAFFSPFAVAGDENDVPKIVVAYDDLNVNTDEGATTLYRRLNAASRAVCRPLDGRELPRRARYLECRETSLNAAVAQVESRALASLHERSTPRAEVASSSSAINSR